MYGFQFRIFMRSGHSGGAGKEGKEGRPERILCYASIEKWEDQRGEGWAGEEPGPAAGIHVEFAFSIFSAWAKAPAQQPVSRSLEWYCQASRGQGKVRKVPLLFAESSIPVSRASTSHKKPNTCLPIPIYALQLCTTGLDIFQEIISAL